MAPSSRWKISCAVFRFGQSNYYLNITPDTTVGEAKRALLDAIKAARPPADEPVLSPEPETVPASPSDIVLFTPNKDSGWSRLNDDSNAASDWGISDAGEVGVSFKSKDGKFKDPHVIRPHDEPDEDDEEVDADEQ